MSPLDSPIVRQRPLPATKERLHGEKLSANSVEHNWSLRKTVLFAVSASLILWAGIIVVILRIF